MFLKKEHNLTEVKINQFSVGLEPPVKKKEISRSSKIIVAAYRKRDLEQYLTGIAHDLELQIN